MVRTPLGTMASKYGHGPGDISSFHGAAQRVSRPNRPFGRWADVGQRKNGRSGEKNLSAIGCAWAVPGGIPSGWGQFGAVKKWAVVIGGLRRQLTAPQPPTQVGPAEPPQRPPGLRLEPISPLLRRGATRTTFCPPGPLPHALWAPTGGWQISPGSSQAPSVGGVRHNN